MTKQVTHIEGRRWFQRTYGSTYNSVVLHFNDGTQECLDKSYGYGDYYLQRAYEHLQAKELIPSQDSKCASWALRDLGISYSVVDVSRERDL